MRHRFFIINIITIIIAVVALTALLVSNKPASDRQDDGEKVSHVDYRTYSYGMNKDAMSSYTKLLSLYRDGQKNSYICASLEQCGNSLYLNGYYAKAFEAYIMAMQMAEEMADRQMLTGCYYNIGNIFVIFKDYERAAHYYEKVLAQPEAERKQSTRSLALRYLVMCYTRMGDVQKAQRAYRDACRHPLSDKNINAYYGFLCRGMLLEKERKYGQALEMQRKAYSITREKGLKIGMGAYPLSECGRAFAAMGNIEKAISCQRMAMQVARNEKAYDQFDEACVALDSLFRKCGEKDSAVVYLNLHRKMSEEMLSLPDFNAARNKLINYEDGVKTRKIDILEQKVNVLAAGIMMFLVVLAVIVFYSNKLRKAYRMLAMKNQQLIAQQDENRKFSSAGSQVCCDDRLLEKIERIMNDTSIICQSDFSLQQLAKLSESNTKYVSAAISTTEQGSFKAMLNEYRIKEACRRLIDEKYAAYTIQAVAETVGYASVNNFIVQFKRYTGMTPSLYRKNAVAES